ncbi:F0F1 ATP synthase subunit A [Aggregicoccus sp. 17bor-14]|uniref:F0F1 ATP synthase subunit A n=1 Tax=Myxococcaceae TaxID=31 RepID=UPI00129D10F7|nr:MULTISPECIES: F0F1 ATP synthase subunit A [Myxococcaceae]MBF5045839.1 F0F1 ATP synthase subunit A [Simulacricoccus sp. 17bor-14]MRI91573.1 F0F1 ATP synthase subunit A [Aggregicoccus sp. 17bor-14]
MKKAMVLLAVLMTGAAFGQEPEHGAAAEHGTAAHGASAAGGEHAESYGERVEEHEENTAEYILHHVSDSNEYEFEVPLSRTRHVVHLPRILIPTREGGCAVDAHGNAGPGCIDLSITKHTVMMWLAAVLLLLAMLLGTNRNKNKLVPRGTSQNLFEMLVLFVRDELAIKNIGKEDGPRYTPYLLTAFFFILFMNLLGLFPWMASATGNIAVTCGLALCTFFVTQAASIRAAGLKGYLAHLTGGVHWALWPIMIPVEFLGLFTKPFALTIRLFANMLAGHIVIFFLLGLIFMLGHPAVALVSVPFALGIYLLELFVAFVQAYVFTMLSALFIGMGVAMGHHGHGDHHDHGDADAGHVEGAHSHDHGAGHHI